MDTEFAKRFENFAFEELPHEEGQPPVSVSRLQIKNAITKQTVQ